MTIEAGQKHSIYFLCERYDTMPPLASNNIRHTEKREIDCCSIIGLQTLGIDSAIAVAQAL
ncbi:Uncharacterized protein APZ42_031607 [Daphnia magna]|uniref:Uncharacterized protein n=1 Tax=Daphnia magna TaxID=35525 RepID=A0A164MQ84_9CRUS|nr:Uncharacterized protein APZ42_031607 [Daphnia magna]